METKRKIIWTRAARDLLYQRAIELFGPYSEWKNNRSPGRGMDAQYDLFCHAFAELVGAEFRKGGQNATGVGHAPCARQQAQLGSKPRQKHDPCHGVSVRNRVYRQQPFPNAGRHRSRG